ncbi:MAG: hypothetical protein ABR567_13030 [Myxococcales bacterium]|nr:hypothetical protein [Myxococcales bacterium]
MKRLAFFCVAAAAAAVAQTVLHSAQGSGHIQFASNEEFISFNAVQRSDGSASGIANVHDISAGVTVQIAVDCLNVVGDTATISGIVTRSSDPSRVPTGFEGIFQVVDGGEGSGSVDLMSLVNFFAVGTGTDCNAPGEFDLVPVDHGNIQVR